MKEKDYREKLNEMFIAVIRKFGYEHKHTIHFAEELEKYINETSQQNFNHMNNLFEKIMKHKTIF